MVINLESRDILHQKIEELQRVEELKNIFPEVFEDGKLNLDKFKNILFDIKDEKTEHYSFNWSGKQDCYKIIKQKSNLTLKVDDEREFYFCFADKVKTDIQEFVSKDAKLICFDKALDDSMKLNLRQNLDLETL